MVLLCQEAGAATTQTAISVGDGYISSGRPDTVMWGAIQAGYTATGTPVIAKRRGLVKFNTALPASAVSNATASASLSMYLYLRSVNTATTIYLSKPDFTTSWTEADFTWTDNSDYNGDYASTSCGAVGTYTWSWNGYNNLPAATGIVVRNADEATANLSKVFTDRENSAGTSGATPPTLTVIYTYTAPTGDPNVIRKWAYLGHFADASDHNTRIYRNYIDGTYNLVPVNEAQLAPNLANGSTGPQLGSSTYGGPFYWKKGTATTDVVSLLSAPFYNVTAKDNGTTYCVAYVYYTAATNNAVYLATGSDDCSRVWLNGTEVGYWDSPMGRGALVDQDWYGPMTLQNGWNRLVMKVENGTGGYGVYARFANSAGNYIGNTTNYNYDATAPSTPVVSVSGVTSGVWQNTVSAPTFTWTSGTDSQTTGEGVSGVRGQKYYFGPSSTGALVTYKEGTSGLSYAPGAQSDGTSYFRVDTVDYALNESSIATFEFKYDGTKPTNPSASCSDGKASGVWRNNASPTFSLTGAADATSGLKDVGSGNRYSYYFGTDSNGTPNVNTDSTSISPTVGADGTYYLRVVTRDNAGNVSDPVTVFTFNHDATAPSAAPAYSTGASTTGIIVNFGASSGDNLSGLATAAYKVTRGSYDSGWVTSGPVTDPAADIADGGSATYTVTTLDNAGNQATDTVTGRKPLAATNNWVFTTKAVSLAPPGLYPQQLAANTKVFASSDSKVYGFGGAAASALWVPVATGGAVQGRVIPATLAGELTALAGSQDGKVYARKVSDGTARWTHDFGGTPTFKVTAKPAGVIGVTVNGSYTGDVVFAATDAPNGLNMLRAFQAGDGTVLWTYSATLGPILGSPLVLPSKGLVVFATMPGGSDTGRVVAVKIADGTMAWQQTAVGDVRSAVSPDGAESTVFVVNQSGQLYALDSSSGVAKSGFPVSVGATGIYGAPMWHGNGPRLYVSSLGDTFYALNPANGGTATGWSSSVSVTGPSNPVVFNQRVYVGSADGNLYEYNINTGAQTGYRAIGSTVGDPVVDAWLSRIYVGAGDGRIYSFSLPF